MIKNFRVLLLAVILFNGILFLADGQPVTQAREDVFFAPADSQKLAFHLNNKTFFKNNEYFNPLEEGYTLPGVVLEPSLVYYPGATTRIEAGASMLKYSGRDGVYRTDPLFRFQYQPVSYFQMVVGTLYGGSLHGLIEPLYRWERDFTNPVENGAQFLFKTDRLKADVWIDWEKFILQGDPFQEQLTFGTTFSWKLLPGQPNFDLYLPFQTLVGHHGGQITSIDLPLQTIANMATGLQSVWRNPGGFIHQVDFDCWVMTYNDLSPQKLQAYKNGYAIYPKVALHSGGFILDAGYFRGERFISPKGEALFHSATVPYNGYAYEAQNVVSAKLIYQKKIQKGLWVAAYFEGYNSSNNSKMDYDYGFHLLFDKEFFIARIK
ncbi:MAG: hypothetical protein Q8928_11335 [Bacteroidota bacterium]|nr:hypothetical protein [Bacteroidota bacterium]